MNLLLKWREEERIWMEKVGDLKQDPTRLARNVRTEFCRLCMGRTAFLKRSCVYVNCYCLTSNIHHSRRGLATCNEGLGRSHTEGGRKGHSVILAHRQGQTGILFTAFTPFLTCVKGGV